MFGQEPLLLPTITPVIPYPLAVRVTNIGYGPATNFQIQSAQPQILDNAQNLPVDFTLLGTQVGGTTIPNTLLIPFGTVQPNGVSQASWVMSSSLSGRFTSFTSTFTHAADLGGQLTSLLQNVTTYTLIKDVLVVYPGRDSVPDFMVNETMDRGAMQAVLDAGTQPPAQYVLESDQINPLTVTEIPGVVSGALSGANATLNLGFANPVSTNVWVHSYAPFTYREHRHPRLRPPRRRQGARPAQRLDFEALQQDHFGLHLLGQHLRPDRRFSDLHPAVRSLDLGHAPRNHH